MARKPDPTRGATELVIFIMLLIPLGIYYLCKWTIKGIIAVCVAITNCGRKKSQNNYPIVKDVPKLKPASPKREQKVHNLQSYPKTENESRARRKDVSFDMAVRLGAGRYVFGGNIPLGTYNLKVVSGEGTLTMQKLKGTEWGEDWFDFGKDEGYIKSYHGLSLPEGKWFEVEGDVIFEISKAEMLDID